MVEYDNFNLFPPHATDDFRRRDWIAYGAYWLATGKSAQQYVDKIEAARRVVTVARTAVRKSIEDKLQLAADIRDWLGDDSDPLE